MATSKSKESKLPGLPFSPEQLFWISGIDFILSHKNYFYGLIYFSCPDMVFSGAAGS